MQFPQYGLDPQARVLVEERRRPGWDAKKAEAVGSASLTRLS
ncbi:hypothetical protein AB0D80_38600 [Streptomyces tendae]